MNINNGVAMRIRGDSYFNRIDPATNLPVGKLPIDGVTSMIITINSDMKTKLSKGRYTAGMVNGSVPDRKSTEMSVKFDQFTVDTWMLAFMGSSTTLSAGGGSITDEVVVANLGYFVELAHRNVTAASVVVTNSGASTTYVEGTDYEINYKLGYLRAITGGAITDAQSLKVDYAHGAYTGFKINAEASIQIKGEFVLDGVNEADGKNVTVTIPMVSMVSKSKLDFLGDDFGEMEMAATPILVSGETSPYYVEVWD